MAPLMLACEKKSALKDAPTQKTDPTQGADAAALKHEPGGVERDPSLDKTIAADDGACSFRAFEASEGEIKGWSDVSACKEYVTSVSMQNIDGDQAEGECKTGLGPLATTEAEGYYAAAFTVLLFTDQDYTAETFVEVAKQGSTTRYTGTLMWAMNTENASVKIEELELLELLGDQGAPELRVRYTVGYDRSAFPDESVEGVTAVAVAHLGQRLERAPVWIADVPVRSFTGDFTLSGEPDLEHASDEVKETDRRLELAWDEAAGAFETRRAQDHEPTDHPIGRFALHQAPQRCPWQD